MAPKVIAACGDGSDVAAERVSLSHDVARRSAWGASYIH